MKIFMFVVDCMYYYCLLTLTFKLIFLVIFFQGDQNYTLSMLSICILLLAIKILRDVRNGYYRDSVN